MCCRLIRDSQIMTRLPPLDTVGRYPLAARPRISHQVCQLVQHGAVTSCGATSASFGLSSIFPSGQNARPAVLRILLFHTTTICQPGPLIPTRAKAGHIRASSPGQHSHLASMACARRGPSPAPLSGALSGKDFFLPDERKTPAAVLTLRSHSVDHNLADDSYATKKIGTGTNKAASASTRREFIEKRAR